MPQRIENNPEAATGMRYPNPDVIYPIDDIKSIVYLKTIIKNPQIVVGDYAYYEDYESVYNFEKMCYISMNP